MGAKTWMLVYSDGDVSEELRNNSVLDRAGTDKLVKTLFPKEQLLPIENCSLSGACPPNDIIFSGRFEGVTVIAAKEFGGDYPSKLSRHFIDQANSKFVYLHAMHSVVDWLAFAKWEESTLVRSLSVCPDSGIMEDIGEKLPFEQAYWQGKWPVTVAVNAPQYPLPFHPLELGEEALKAFFGYQLEGYGDESLMEPDDIALVGYKRKRNWWKIW